MKTSKNLITRNRAEKPIRQRKTHLWGPRGIPLCGESPVSVTDVPDRCTCGCCLRQYRRMTEAGTWR